MYRIPAAYSLAACAGLRRSLGSSDIGSHFSDKGFHICRRINTGLPIIWCCNNTGSGQGIDIGIQYRGDNGIPPAQSKKILPSAAGVPDVIGAVFAAPIVVLYHMVDGDAVFFHEETYQRCSIGLCLCEIPIFIDGEFNTNAGSIAGTIGAVSLSGKC